MSELYKLTVRWGNGLIDEILYDPETSKSVAVEKTIGGVTTIETNENFDIAEILKIFGVPDDIKAALSEVMSADEMEDMRLRYCTHHGCERPFNWSTASRCDFCGDYLPNSDDVAELEKPFADINVQRKMDWANVRKALALAAEGKIKSYVSRENHSCNLSFGWDGLMPFNKKKHSFRGRSNQAVLESYDPSISVKGNKSLLTNMVDERCVSEGFLRFVDKYGEQLMESTTIELNPEGADALRDQYIFDQWEYGNFTDTSSGANYNPKAFFIRNFFNTTHRLAEQVAEAAWDLYVYLLFVGETKAIVRKDGRVEWRFATIEENWDADTVGQFLSTNYNIADADIEFLLDKPEEQSDNE